MLRRDGYWVLTSNSRNLLMAFRYCVSVQHVYMTLLLARRDLLYHLREPLALWIEP
jgi:hypothetical protein